MAYDRKVFIMGAEILGKVLQSVGSGVSGTVGMIGSLWGAEKEAEAQRDAAKMRSETARQNAGDIWGQYQQSRGDLMPWQQAGTQALQGLSGGQFGPSSQYDPYQQYQQSQGLGQFQNFGIDPMTAYQQQAQPFQFDPSTDPGYQFRLQQGVDALEGSAAASGGLFSGQTGKDITGYAQNLASQEYQNAFNRDMSTKGQLGQAYGQAFGQNMAQQQAGFGQDLMGRQYGSQEFYNALGADTARGQDEYNRLFGIAGMGQNTGQFLAQLGQGSAAQRANALQQGSDYQAQGRLGSTYSLTGGVRDASDTFTSMNADAAKIWS